MPREVVRARRVRGSGSVFYSEARSLWIARRPVGRTPGGRTRYQEVSDANQAQAVAKLQALLPPAPGITVGEWCARWLGGADIRPSTRDSYTYSVRDCIIPTLGYLKLSQLTAIACEQAAGSWVRVGLAPSTARLAMSHLSIACSAAVREGVISVNPVVEARRPKVPRARIDPFTASELSRIIDAATPRPGARIIALLAATGMRDGEAIALDVEDYDPATGLLTITQTYHGKYGCGPAKSANSVRTIRVPVRGRAAVEQAIGGRKSGILFPAVRTGARVKHFVVRRSLDAVLREAGKGEGVAPVRPRNVHQLRHSWASHAIAGGASLADVAKFLGDTVATVVKTYLHPTGSDPSTLMDTILGIA